MFWRVASFAQSSPIDAILDKQSFTLEELLEEDEIIQVRPADRPTGAMQGWTNAQLRREVCSQSLHVLLEGQVAPLVRPQAIRDAKYVHIGGSAPGVHAARSRNQGFFGQAPASSGGEAGVPCVRMCGAWGTAPCGGRAALSIVWRP